MMSRLYYPLFAAVLAAALLLRLNCLTCGSLDEVESGAVLTAQSAVGQILPNPPRDLQGPLSLLLLKQWMRVSPADEQGYELFSVVFGLLSIAAAGLVAARIFGRPTALLTACLLSFSVFHLFYSQYVSGYTAAMFFGLLSAYCYLRFCDRPSLPNALTVLVSGLIFIGMHYAAVIVLPAWFLFGWLARRESRRKHLPPAGLLAIASLPVFMLLKQTELGLPATNDNLLFFFRRLNSDSGAVAALLMNSVVWGAGLRLRQENGKNLLFLALWVTVPVVLSVLLSLLFKPMFFPEHFLLIQPAYVMLAAAGLTAIPWRVMGAVVTALLLFFSAGPLGDYFSRRRSSAFLKEACDRISEESLPGDLLVLPRAEGAAPCAVYETMLPKSAYISRGGFVAPWLFRYASPIDGGEADDVRRIWLLSSPKPLSRQTVDELEDGALLGKRRVKRALAWPSGELWLID